MAQRHGLINLILIIIILVRFSGQAFCQNHTIMTDSNAQKVNMYLISRQGSERATSGDGGKLVTRDGKTHVVWQDSVSPAKVDKGDDPNKAGFVPVSDGYMNRIRTFDHLTQTFGPVITLNKGKDNHARPNITMDHQGYLHVIISGHGSPVVHMQSLRPNDASQWTKPHVIGDGTYPIPAVAPDGTLYVVMRHAKLDGLELYVRDPDGKWREKPIHLITQSPDYPGYAAYHCGMTIAPDGTLHIIADFYEGKGWQDRRGLHQAVTYIQSRDAGRTWNKANGTKIPLPARPDDMDMLAQDIAPERHEDLPPPLITSPGAIVLDSTQSPHALYIDHRNGPGAIMHAVVDDKGTWSSKPIDALSKAFAQHRPITCNSAFARQSEGVIGVLLELMPLGDGWNNGLPTRKMRMGSNLDKRLAWLYSTDRGLNWFAIPAMAGNQFNQPTVERITGGNHPNTQKFPAFIYFDGDIRYPKIGEVIQNNVYLMIP